MTPHSSFFSSLYGLWFFWATSIAPIPTLAQDRNFDIFNYGDTIQNDNYNSFGPPDWIRVQCPDLDQCVGWHDKWETGVGWELDENSCRWCPATGNNCGTHHQSPINMLRDIADETANSPFSNPCIDVHWMAYFDSTCTFDELRRNNAFTVERHALKVIQPIIETQEQGSYRIGCRNHLGRRWGKIDFSKGFSEWWHLSHADFHVPSEHTQGGKRYDGEVQLYHFYSVSGEEAGVNNELAAVTVFLQTYEGSQDYDVLNRIICQWRKYEDDTRKQCGLPSVTKEYPGCFNYKRGHASGNSTVSTASLNTGERKLRTNSKPRPKAISAHDIIMHNAKYNAPFNTSHKPKLILMDEEDFKDEDDFDWDSFIGSLYENDATDSTHRHLLDYHHVDWFNYFPMIGSRTEYYYRYSGTQTIPPCYGRFTAGSNRARTNNWRVMKDPIRISKRQLEEMHRLLKERIAPIDSPMNACQPDTAAKPHPDDPENKVWVARPVQSTHKAHHTVFCECDNWGSKFKEDKQWCRIKDKAQRFYTHPYNYETEGY